VRRLWAVIAFEVSQRRLAFAGALASGVVPWLLPLFFRSSPAADIRVAAATTGGVLLAWGLALIFGVTAVGSDLAAGRMGFHFAQPISTGTLWAGRFGAAALLPIVGGALVLLPTALFEPQTRSDIAREQVVVHLALILLSPAIVFLANAFGVMLRSRSLWTVLPLVTTLLAGLVCAGAYYRMMSEGTEPLIPIVGSSAMAIIVLGLTACSFLQVSGGRTSLARANRILCLGLSASVLVAAAGVHLYAKWAVSPSFEDLRGALRAGVLSPDWLLVSGPTRGRPGYDAVFLLHRDRGSVVPLPAAHAPYRGRTSLWHASEGGIISLYRSPTGSDLPTLWWTDLTVERPRPTATGIAPTRTPLAIRLSPSGRRLAMIVPEDHRVGHRIVIRELPSGRIITSRALAASLRPVTAPSWNRYGWAWQAHRLRFLDEDRILLVTPAQAGDGFTIASQTFDVDSQTFAPGTRVEHLSVRNPLDLRLSSDGSTVVGEHGLYSTESGLELQRLDPDEQLRWQRDPLNGGRVLEWKATFDGDVSVEIHPSTDAPRRLKGNSTGLGFSGELPSGVLASTTGQFFDWTTRLWFIPIPSGTPVKISDGIILARPLPPDGILAIDLHGSLIEYTTLGQKRKVWVEGELSLGDRGSLHRTTMLRRLWGF